MSDLHLDDEAISAVLDGEAAPEDSAHADACADCDARLAVFRDASLLVRTPVPPAAAETRERAIAAALDAMPATVVPFRARRTPPAWLAAAAAVLVVALASVALIGRGGDDDPDDGFAAGNESADTMAADEELSTMAEAPSVVDGGDLGAIDVTALQDIVDGALLGNTQAVRENGEPEDGDAATTAAEDDAASGAGGVASAAVSCEDQLRVDNEQLGALVYRATGTLDGEDVAVLAFDVASADGSVDRWVYVVSAETCAVRNQQTFSA